MKQLLTSDQQQHRASVSPTIDRIPDKDDEKPQRNKNHVNGNADSAALTNCIKNIQATVVDVTEISSGSSFEERERQMMEQVERQVRNIYHFNI